MREGGLVRVQDGTAVVGDLDTLDVPATIEGAVLSRIDRLTAGQLLCLKVAAVIGRSFLVAHGRPPPCRCARSARRCPSTSRPSPAWT